MAPAPKSAPAPETPSPASDSSPPPPPDSPPPPPPPSTPSPPPPKPSKTPPAPPPPKPQPPPPADDDDSKPTDSPPPNASPPPASPPPTVQPPPVPGFLPPAATSPPPPATIPTPPSIIPNNGDGSDKTAPGPARKMPSPSNRKSASKSSPDSDSISDYSATNIPIIIGGIAAAVAVFLALVILCVLCKRKKRKGYYLPEQGPGAGGPYYYGKPDHVVKVGSHPPPTNTSNEFLGPRMSVASVKMPLAFSQYQFSYDELVEATGGFTQYNILGQGGFGYVHKGVLPNGQEIAVKSLKSGSGQGEREFQAEVEIISRVHHRYLVSLVGYCISDGQRMLVYEYVPNNTLDFHLHGKGQVVMDWQTRMRIALGSAKGLAYLHEDCMTQTLIIGFGSGSKWVGRDD